MAELAIPWLLLASARRQAVVDEDTSLTSAELADAAPLAGRVAQAHRISAGDRVADWAPSTHRWIVSALGAALRRRGRKPSRPTMGRASRSTSSAARSGGSARATVPGRAPRR